MSGFNPYPAYKDSGVDCLGEVPEHWEVLALSRLLAAPVTDGPHTTPDFVDDGVPFLSVDGIQDGKLYFEGCRYVSFEDHKEFSKKAAPRYNDLLMGKAASIGKIARVTENIEFSIWSPLALIRVNEKQCSPNFLEFCLKSSELQHQILLASNRNTQLNIGMKDIPTLRLPLPSIQEQTQIARFLDHETARIDSLIAEQQRLIELLKEKRQAVISHAVTKGLDPTVPMKDSGEEWLGEVPEHWVVRKVSVDFSATKGPRGALLTKEYCHENPGEYPVYSGQTENGGVLGEIADYDFDLGKQGAILSTTVGAKAMSVSHVTGQISLSQNCMIIKSINPNIDIKFFFYHFQPLFLLERKMIPDHMQPSFRMEDLYAFRIATPPEKEQTQISNFLDRETARIDALISDQQQMITFLKEKRQALISAAVTGKIDVRNT